MNEERHGLTLARPGRTFDTRGTFAALRFPNYRLWFKGQIVSLFGTWMQTTAQGFLVYELTGSAAYLGFVGFSSGVPSWLLTLYGGVVADRVSRRRLLIVTQSSMMLCAFVLSGITFLHVVEPWHILLLSFLLGTANAFDAPARQAFVSEMVEPDALTNAIALNSTMFNSALAAGPAVAGFVYAAFGPGWCFAINGLSFVGVIAALAFMKLPGVRPPRRREPVLEEIKEGFRHVAAHEIIGILFVVIALNQLLVFSLSTILPAWSVSILGGDATTNGFLFSARGIGALIGALVIAALGHFSGKGRLLSYGAFASAVLLTVFALSRWIPGALVLMVGIGVGTIFVMNLANAMIQMSTPEQLRGRVMGAYTWIFFGFMPLGALWCGELAAHVGLVRAVVINGILALAATCFIWFKFPRLRMRDRITDGDGRREIIRRQVPSMNGGTV